MNSEIDSEIDGGVQTYTLGKKYSYIIKGNCFSGALRSQRNFSKDFKYKKRLWWIS